MKRCGLTTASIKWFGLFLYYLEDITRWHTFNNMGLACMIMTFVLLSEKHCVLRFLSASLQSQMWRFINFPVCMCPWACVCPVGCLSSVSECVPCTRHSYVHVDLRGYIFFWRDVTWMHFRQGGDTHRWELPLLLRLLSWCSGTTRTGNARSPVYHENDKYGWPIGRNMFSICHLYASDTTEKLAVKREPLVNLLSSSWNLSDLYTTESLPSSTLYL